jgi:hypothetical protein
MNKFTHTIIVLLAMLLASVMSPLAQAEDNMSTQEVNEISAACEARIEGLIRSSIAFDKTLRNQAVYVDVKQGEVTLSGQVNSPDSQRLLLRIVKEITDDLDVQAIYVQNSAEMKVSRKAETKPSGYKTVLAELFN